MTEAPIDRVEAIDVDQHHRSAIAASAGAAERALQLLEIGMAAGQTGQGVDLGRRIEPGAASLPGECHPDRPLQPLDRELLLVEEVGGPGIDRGEVQPRHAAVAQQDQGRRHAVPPGGTGEAQAVLAPEPMLDQGDVVSATQEPCQPVLRVGGTLDQERAVLRPGQQLPHQQHIVLEVVDEQDPRRRPCRRGSLDDGRRHRGTSGARQCERDHGHVEGGNEAGCGRRLREAVVTRVGIVAAHPPGSPPRWLQPRGSVILTYCKLQVETGRTQLTG